MIGKFCNKYLLPYPDKTFIKYIENSKNNPPKNDAGFGNSQIEEWKTFFGHELNKKDLDELVRLIDLSNKGSKNMFSPFNHGLAVANSKDRLEIINEIQALTLISHGENDPCFPQEHGQFLYQNIPNSKLEIVKGMGHMFSLSEATTIANKIIS